ncbi:hypothetical protein [Nocardioides taihuensis]|uniref:Patatin-like phospholipase family protein n=1 Tax=Nocardioides taihuensis TaxID=1835606 RepID=A0ABW0BLM1_9ACTN
MADVGEAGDQHDRGSGPGVSVGLVALGIVLAVGAVLTAPRADLPPGSEPGILGLELMGTAQAASAWAGSYAAADVVPALRWDVLFILCWAPLLALLCWRLGRGYRTASTRRLAVPVAAAALAAGALDLVEDLGLWLAIDGGPLDGTWSGGWQLAAVCAWGKWVVVLLAAGYAIGGLATVVLTPRWIRRVLAGTGTAPEGPVGFTPRSGDEVEVGLAFSGGGVRAASISLGALQALERDSGPGWDTVHDVTSVSGGSYMTGAWSVARCADLAPAAPPPASFPRPWAQGGIQVSPEEEHLRANLGYLLSNTPRGAAAAPADPGAQARARRSPAAVATVLTGMAVNAAVLLGLLFAVSQPLGWFYRWYVGLGCRKWHEPGTLSWDRADTCLVQPDRLGGPVLAAFGFGLVLLVLWVGAAKATEQRRGLGGAWLLGLKYAGYGGLALGALLLVLLVVLPAMLWLFWRPVVFHDLWSTLATVVAAVGSASAVLRLLRKPLARIAPVVGGILFALLLLLLASRWALTAVRTGPWDGAWVPWAVVVGALLLVHVLLSPEAWSLAAFYRGKLRLGFATYRLPWSSSARGVEVRAYANGDGQVDDRRPEPSLSELSSRATGPGGTPLTVCAAATVTGREVRTHYGIPAISVTFSPDHVRTFWPEEANGLWRAQECTTAELESLMPRGGPRLTTFLAVGLSGAAVSPAMGRFRLGPVSMLLTFANVRLGMWVPNPRYASALAVHGSRLPRPRLGYLLKEFVGMHDPSDLFLYVTDGGHWENTALVELLRTAHHRELVCIDADSGPGNLVGSISKAIDLAQLECAATVAINLDVLRSDADPTPGRDYSPRSVNLGLVRRTDSGEERISVLWYAKPALTQDMPPKLLAYREVDPTFPRVSTINQFFHLAQFEAYRDLGRYNGRRIRTARRQLATATATHAQFTAFRDWVSEVEPDGWVYAELVTLVERLADDQPAAERPAYQEWLYGQVRETLAAR